MFPHVLKATGCEPVRMTVKTVFTKQKKKKKKKNKKKISVSKTKTENQNKHINFIKKCYSSGNIAYS